VSTDPLFTGLSGLEAASTQIDVSANNVANVGTSGFQAQDVGFEDIYAGAVAVGVNGLLVENASGLTVTAAGGGPIAIPPGVTGLASASDGTVTGTLAGRSATFGRIALAAFQDPAGLLRVGGGYQASANAGNALLGAPGSAGYGTLIPGAVESSNVDLTSEFVKMIAAQAAFAANAKAVHTADENLKTILDLD
jgi:flagellar hook protein FlgE